MNERIIAEGKRKSLKALLAVIGVLAIVIVAFTVDFIIKSAHEEQVNEKWYALQQADAPEAEIEAIKRAHREARYRTGNAQERCEIVNVYLFVVAAILLLVYFSLKNIEIVVSDKRVYGRASFSKRVDLPLDAISAVETSAMSGIVVSSASGKIAFKMLKNRDAIHKAISDLLLERQGKNTHQNEVVIPQSNADELKKYKELLDSGIITQEEFDAKKKNLLGL